MFTGIIEATATVLDVQANGLILERPKSFDDIKIGSSIAVSGACLSVTRLTKKEMQFDVVETTLSKTKLGALKKGDRVNLERAMRADARFEGHIVTGHVEGVARVMALSLKVGGTLLTFSLPPHLLPFVVPHGSITIDGVSLTVANVAGPIISVALIPLTLGETTLGTLQEHDLVNIETDILAKYLLSSHHATS